QDRRAGAFWGRLKGFSHFGEGGFKVFNRFWSVSLVGRKLTPQGQRDLDRIAGQGSAASKKH
uniref:Uncharacterized protein n=1 Tax=Buteo japonicus TaxID=224669 RepID=A0A8C0BM57_9AVES